jgi:acyl carrier protein
VIDSEAVLSIISKEAAVDRARLTGAATLDDLGVASLDVVSILFAIEDKCGTPFDPAEFEGVRTVQQFTDIILAKANAPLGASSRA